MKNRATTSQVPLRALAFLAFIGTLASCSEDTSNDSTEEDSAALSAWSGDWKSAKSLYLDDGLAPLILAIQEERPEYDEEEIRDFIVSAVDVDYDEIVIDGASVSFLESGSVQCEGSYSVEKDEGDADSHQPGSLHATLEAETDGDCSAYIHLSLSEVRDASPERHFHLIHGDDSGNALPPPWNPALWTPTTTSEWLADYFEPQASQLASALPDK